MNHPAHISYDLTVFTPQQQRELWNTYFAAAMQGLLSNAFWLQVSNENRTQDSIKARLVEEAESVADLMLQAEQLRWENSHVTEAQQPQRKEHSPQYHS